MNDESKQPPALGEEFKNEVRKAFMANGFTVKEGNVDLKPYVYDAAQALVTPLLADIARLKEGSDRTLKAIREQWKASDQKWMRERDTLKAELTKARALLVEVMSGTGTSPGANKKYGAIRAYLSEKPTCRTCKGSGIEYDGAGHTCTACNGSGASKPAAKDGE